MSNGMVTLLAVAMAASVFVFSLMIVLIQQLNHNKLMRIHPDKYLRELGTTRRIKAFEKLQSLCYNEGYHGPHLTDNTPEHIAQCIQTWLRLKGHYSAKSGILVEAKIFDEPIVFEVTSGATKPDSKGRHWVKDFAAFLEFYEKTF